MTDKLVLKPKRRVIEHAGLRQHDRVLQRAAADQSVRLQLFNIVIKAECSGRRNEIGIIRSREFNMQALLPNQRVRKIDIVLNRECFRWINDKCLVTVLQSEFFGDTNVLSRSFLLHNAGPRDGLRIRTSASIQNGNLEIVELDICIVDTDAVQGGKKMLNGRNLQTATHERRCIRHACNPPDISSQLKIIKIDTAEYDALARGSRKDSKRCVLAGVQSNARELDRSCDRLLVHRLRNQQFGRRSSSDASLTSYEPNTALNRVHLCTTVARKKQSQQIL